MTEYIIIVALIAIGTIVLVTAFGDNIRALFGNAASALAGQTGTMQPTQPDDTQQKKDLKNFSEQP